jgi:uncharacterized protein (TIGR02058 family)
MNVFARLFDNSGSKCSAFAQFQMHRTRPKIGKAGFSGLSVGWHAHCGLDFGATRSTGGEQTMRRYVVELGTGIDLHGADVTKAATRAVRDAISRSCLCGLLEIAGLKDPDEMRVRVHIACPTPDRLDGDAVRAAVPFGQVRLDVEAGGMVTEGLHIDRLGAGDRIVVALAAITVSID